MSAAVCLELGSRPSWLPFLHALTRGATRRGEVRVVDELGAVVADLLTDAASGGRYTATLSDGLSVALTGAATPTCVCQREEQRPGCLHLEAGPDGAVVIRGRCPRVVVESLCTVIGAHPGALVLELADPGVLPRRYREAMTRVPALAIDPEWLYTPVWARSGTPIGEADPGSSRRGAGRGGRRFGGDRCVDCNRLLSDDLSIERGRGSICDGRHRAHLTRTARSGRPIRVDNTGTPGQQRAIT